MIVASTPSFGASTDQQSPPDAGLSFNIRFISQVSVVAALGGLLFGFDTAIISGAIPYIQPYFRLDEYSLGWAVGAILVGCGVGALLTGWLAEAYGRRPVLIGCAVLFALSGIGVALSNTLTLFVVFRLMGGLGVGAAALASPMYIAEMAPAHWRGRLVSLYQLAIVLGILLAYYANYTLADIGPSNWRWMFASQTAPALFFWLSLLLVPETPRWLVAKNRLQEAERILQKIGGSPYATSELTTIKASFDQQSPVALPELFAARYRPVVGMGVLMAIFQQITGINAILYYAPVIFRETGLNTSGALLQTIAIGAANVLSCLIAIRFVDKLGRRTLLLAGSALMGVSLVVLALCFQTGFFRYYIVLLSTLLYVAAFGATLGAVTWVFLSEIFPNRIRSLALSVATFMLWLADFVVTYTFPVLTERLGTSLSLTTYALFCTVTFGYVLMWVPETKGKTLEELSRQFGRKAEPVPHRRTGRSDGPEVTR
jgi:sugar porter (SP) family MFS transporter